MRKNKLHKQILSFFVVCAIIFGSIPSVSFAEDMSVEQDTAQPAQAAEGQAAAEVVQNTEDPVEGTAEPTEQQAVEEAPQEGQGTGEQQPEAPGQRGEESPGASGIGKADRHG